jgi:zinc transport system ATP-binding protein
MTDLATSNGKMNVTNCDTIVSQSVTSDCGACCTKIEDLGVRMGSVAVLEHVSLHLHCGQLLALIGPNGAGKTTLLRAMLGELPHTGALHFLPVRRGSHEVEPRIGYVPQRLEMDTLAPATVLDLFAAAMSWRSAWLGASRRTVRETTERLATVDAANLLHRKLGQLSPGQLQRVLLALALTPVPDILLLDEPVAGVDQAGIELFYQMVSEFRRTYDLAILLISHDLPVVARFADRMIFLKRTILCDGTPREVLSNPVVRQAFGFDFSPSVLERAPAPSHHPARGAQ